jgi:hypothetical protein
MAPSSAPKTSSIEDHPLYDAFVLWAQRNLSKDDDRLEFWPCFLAGARAATKVRPGYRLLEAE